jgi:hypothetical protein
MSERHLPDPLGPMVTSGAITTLFGPADAELAALVAALAVSSGLGDAGPSVDDLGHSAEPELLDVDS